MGLLFLRESEEEFTVPTLVRTPFFQKISATVMRARPAFQGSRYGLVIPRKPTEALR